MKFQHVRDKKRKASESFPNPPKKKVQGRNNQWRRVLMSSNTCVSPAAAAAAAASPFLGDAFQSRIQRLAENVKCGNRKSLPDSHKDSKRLPARRIAGESALINKRAKRDRGTRGITSLLMEVILSFPRRPVGLRGLTHTTGGDRGIPGLRENHPRLRIGM